MSSNTTYAIITGSVFIVLFSTVFYFFWPSSWNIFKTKAITQGNEKKEDSKPKAAAPISPKPAAAAAAASPKPAVVETKPAEVTVEDIESDDEETDDEEEEEDGAAANAAKAAEEEALLLKSKYDDANRLAGKLIAGNQHARAAEKLSEAIELAKSVGAAANKDIPTLYNNRSAMYEKCGEFDKSLSDIMIILTMDPNHMRARARRARIYEAQGKNSLALYDYVYGMVVERMKQENPSNDRKIEILSRKVAAENAATVLQSIRTNKFRPLPSKRYNFLYARNFLETFPNFHQWKAVAATQKQADLTAAIAEAVAEGSVVNKVTATLQLVCFQLAQENYIAAFETFASIEADYKDKVIVGAAAAEGEVQEGCELPREVVSLCWEMKGTEMHLKCYLSGAQDAYVQATRWNPVNVEAKLKLASIHMEVGENAQANAVYADLLDRMSVVATPPVVPTTGAHDRQTDRGDGTPVVAAVPDEEAPSTPGRAGKLVDVNDLVSPVDSDDERNAVTAQSTPMVGLPVDENKVVFDVSTPQLVGYKAWTLIHRSNTYLALNDQMQYQTDAIKNAIRDIDTGLALADSVLDTPVGKAARFVGLMKSVHVLTQTKQLVGETTSPAEAERNSRSIAEAARLFPKHESRLLMEADLLSSEGESDRALALIEEVSQTTLKGDVTPLVMKASIMCTKALIAMQNGPQPTNEYEANLLRATSQEMFSGVESHYSDALALEANSVEVLAQYAQFKNMVTGDFQGAVDMLKRAVPLARTRDEALELCQLLVMNEAQWAAIQEIQKQF